MKRAIVILVLLVAARARADEASARAAFEKAEDLRKAGKWADACPLYDASYRDDPQLGVLLHLAECHEKIGRLATAWSEFNDAAELAKSRTDSREAKARAAAARLAPRLDKLHVAPPPQLYAGLVVKLDGGDVTVLVGTDMPVDPGPHALVASAPGFVDWKADVTITGEGAIAQQAIPALDKVPVVPVVAPPPVVHEGTVTITAPDGAKIVLDDFDVGVGSYTGKIKSGGHTLRVTAPGMRMYQGEVVVGDGEERKVDVVLEKEEVAPVAVVAPPAAPVAPSAPSGPSYSAGFELGPGEKMHGTRPALVSYRLDIGFRFASRVDFGVIAAYGRIAAGGNCGTDLPGSMPTTPYDFGTRNRFTSCEYLLMGLQMIVHVLPHRQIDPWIGIAPAFRSGFYDHTPYDAAGNAGTPITHDDMFGIEGGARVGVDYHPSEGTPGWTVGAFVEAQINVLGRETSNHDQGHGGGDEQWVSWLGGARTAIAW